MFDGGKTATIGSGPEPLAAECLKNSSMIVNAGGALHAAFLPLKLANMFG